MVDLIGCVTDILRSYLLLVYQGAIGALFALSYRPIMKYHLVSTRGHFQKANTPL